MNNIKVDIKQCRRIGSIVSKQRFKPSFLNRPFISLPISPEIKAAMYYYSVGICHQTYHLKNIKLNLYGWDFLEYGFMEIAQQNPKLLDANYIHKLSVNQLIKLIKPFFSEDHISVKCSLDSLEERAKLWIDMANFMVKRNLNPIDFFNQTDQKAAYYYKQLPNTIAYSDPLQKKTSFLMKLLYDSKLISINENENIIPIMDYHMQRVLLRSGCVEIINNELKQALLNRKNIDSDTEIRRACISAMEIIANTSGHSIFKMNDIFYALGRSCCNENPLCISQQCEKKPCSLSLTIEIDNHKTCIFQNICKGATNPTYRQYWQPQVTTHFY